MKFTERFANLFDEASYKLNELIQEKGIKGKYFLQKSLAIQDDNLKFNLEGGRYLSEVHEDNLVDELGYTYSFYILETEQFMQVVDHLKEVYGE